MIVIYSILVNENLASTKTNNKKIDTKVLNEASFYLRSLRKLYSLDD
jgi:hypothetical protein